MNEEMNNEVAAEEVPSVEAAETAETHEPLVIRKDRIGREWAEVWRDRKILRIRIDQISAMSLDRVVEISEDGEEEEVTDTVPYVHLAGGTSTRRAGPPSTTTSSATPTESVAKVRARRPPRFAGRAFLLASKPSQGGKAAYMPRKSPFLKNYKNK